jgi:hypothetical protein
MIATAAQLLGLALVAAGIGLVAGLGPALVAFGVGAVLFGVAIERDTDGASKPPPQN